jgi:hypothetical protein
MWWTVVSGVIVLVAATFGGRPYGRALKRRPYWWYVGANVLVILFTVALIAFSPTLGSASASTRDVLYGVALGLGFGGPAGLRHGYKGLLPIDPTKNRS